MNSLPRARGCSSLPVRLDPGRGLALVGVVGLALLAGCGASGEDNNNVVTRPNTNDAPLLGGAGASSVGGGVLGMLDCTGPSGCDGLASEEVTVPPGCGNGTLTADEACDDGNKTSGDGCADTCLRTEPGFSCAVPGQPCREIARCGDGLKAATEQCDDGNVALGDGCSARCRVEIGKKCDGASPSVCTDAICGDGNMEGAEACDDGGTTPFDGCSSTCQVEPNCQGGPCTSACGDGLLLNEDCDDGNLIDGDGCSSACTIEGGFECLPDACDPLAGPCVLRAPAIFRDFAADPTGDFGDNNSCQDLAQGAVAATLNAEGRPTLGANSAAACLTTPANFAEWYTSNPSNNQTLIGEVVLYDNGEGGYVNRYYEDGRQWTFVTQGTERQAGASLAACNNECLNYAQNGQAPFVGQLRCDNDCRQDTDAVAQLTQQLNQLMNANPPDPVAIAAQQALIDAAQLEATACLTTCQTELDARVATCSATCKPCGNNPAMFCIFGVEQTQDGNPLFFPVDSITGGTSDLFTAKVPEQYGYDGFPNESVVFPGRPAASYNHNFYFTSEVQYWFKYDASTVATLTFLGDDDVWVFVNGRLAVDLGGIHVPSTGSVTINGAAGTVVSRAQDGREGANGQPASLPINTPSTAAAFGLQEGNVYKITVFQAERQRDGSSFQLTLAGFEAAPSLCKADCGDGVLSFGEECDDVVNDGGYGQCNAGCVLGPFCGDSVVDAADGETCDVGPVGDATCRGCREFRIY
jgi:fibro-slime domain-containing protein